MGQPELRVDIDRTEASQSGVTQRDVANDAFVSLSSSGQVAPSFWLDPKKGIPYLGRVQTPQYRHRLARRASAILPSTSRALRTRRRSATSPTVRRDVTAVNITHYNVMSTFDVQANVQGVDLGVGVGRRREASSPKSGRTLPRGTRVVVRGQVDSMNASFRGLSYGILAAVGLVYFLMVVNFQSWLDPLIILTALPGAIAGIVWSLFATGTTLSVPALMGAIMSIGVATSNSILMVTFANDRSAKGGRREGGAFLAGVTRLRPV